MNGASVNGVCLLGHFCERHGPTILFVTSMLHGPRPIAGVEALQEVSEDGAAALSSPQMADTGGIAGEKPCKSCQSVSGGGFVQYTAHSTFFTSLSKPESALYGSLRQQCVRSLSAEHIGGTEFGPVLFSEDSTVKTLSYVFHVVDSESRGSTRQYCLCCVSFGDDTVFTHTSVIAKGGSRMLVV
jgi:hypothetical protein